MINAIVLTLLSAILPATLFAHIPTRVRWCAAALCLIPLLSLIVYRQTGTTSVLPVAAMVTILVTLLVALLQSDASLSTRLWAIAGSCLFLALIVGVGFEIGRAISQGSGYDFACLPPTAYDHCPPDWGRLAGFALDFSTVIVAAVFGLVGEVVLLVSMADRSHASVSQG